MDGMYVRISLVSLRLSMMRRRLKDIDDYAEMIQLELDSIKKDLLGLERCCST